MTRSQKIIGLIALTALGTGGRLYAIGAQSLWFDELLSITISRLPISEVIFSPASIDPPVYYILLHFWLRVAREDGMIRLLSAAAGIATVPLIYGLSRRVLNEAVAWVAALICALAPLQIYFAQEVRMYSFLALFATAAIWAYSRAQDLDRWRDWALWSAVMLIALYTHNYAGLTLLALDVHALLRWRARTGNLTRVIISNVVIGLLFLPWFILLLYKLEWLFPALWLKPPNIVNLFATVYLFVFGYTLPFPANLLGMFVVFTALLFIASASWRVWRQGTARQVAGLQLLWLALIVPLAIAFLVSQWKPVYAERLLLEAAPPLYVLLGWGLAQSDRRTIIRLCALVGVPLICAANLFYFTQPEYARSPLRDALAYLAAQRAPDELVVHTSGSSFLAGRHYDPRGKHILLYHPADQWLIPSLMDELRVPYDRDARHLIANQPSFWVVVALDHIPDEQRAEKAAFDSLAILVEQADIGGIGIYRYHLAAR